MTFGRYEYELNRLVQLSRTLERGTTPFCGGPDLLSLRPTSVAVGGRRPSLCTVSVQPDKVDETSSALAQSIVQFAGNPDETSRRIFDRQNRIVPIGPQNVLIGNVPVTLGRIAVHASKQKITPIEFPLLMHALRCYMLHCQVGRQTPLAVAAVATQPVHQVTNRIAVLGIGARCGTAVNRPHSGCSDRLAKASSFRMAPRPGFAE